MKPDVVEFVYSCLVCQKSNIEHHKPYGLVQTFSIPELKWDNISMYFIWELESQMNEFIPTCSVKVKVLE